MAELRERERKGNGRNWSFSAEIEFITLVAVAVCRAVLSIHRMRGFLIGNNHSFKGRSCVRGKGPRMSESMVSFWEIGESRCVENGWSRS